MIVPSWQTAILINTESKILIWGGLSMSEKNKVTRASGRYKGLVNVLVLVLIIGSFSLTLFGCAPAAVEREPAVEEPEDDKPAAEDPDEKPQEAEAADPFGRYDPPITLTTVSHTARMYAVDNLEGETHEDNRWLRTFRDILGINIQYQWLESTWSGFSERVTLAMAAGDLPDFFNVSPVQMRQLMDAGLIAPVGDLFERYASPLTKELREMIWDDPFIAATFDGELMGIPNIDIPTVGAHMIWVRTDWLQKLNLEPPKTMNDVIEIAEAFTTRDPDGNGEHDTTGLALQMGLYGGYAGLEGFFAGFHAYPNMWVKTDEGNIEFGAIQPETREALLALQDMFARGLIDREFGVKDGGKAAELAAAGKNGLHFGAHWNPLWPINMSVENDPNAVWDAFPLVSIDENPALAPAGVGTWGGWTVINKNAQNPEAVIKLINVYTEKLWGETAEFDKFYYTPAAADAPGVDGIWKLPPLVFIHPAKNYVAWEQLEEARRTGNFAALTGQAKATQARIEAGNFGWNEIYGPGGDYAVQMYYRENDRYIRNAFIGAPTELMSRRLATLNTMKIEVFTRIILGDAEIEEFDKFANDWLVLGGYEMSQEVNEWYEATR